MAKFKYSGQMLDHKLTMEVGNILDQAGVPNALWGEVYLNMIGAPVTIYVSLK